MKKAYLIPVIVLVLCCTAKDVWSAKAYVTDHFEITLRTGPSTEHKIEMLLPSGEALEVLETRGNWSRVRKLEDAPGGAKQGWVLNRYLVERLPWRIQVDALSRENKKLTDRLVSLKEQCDGLKQAEKSRVQELIQKTQALEKITAKYETLRQDAADFLQLKESHETTKISFEEAQMRIQNLTEENLTLKKSQRHKWFVMGALVLLFGLLIGVTMGRQQKKRRSLY